MSDTFFGETWEELGINVPSGKTGQIKIKTCPNCVRLGKKRPHDHSLYLGVEVGKANCYKCGAKYILDDGTKRESTFTDSYTPPPRKNMTKLSDRGAKELTDRMISPVAIEITKIVEEKGHIVFPYIYEDALVNAKYRKIGEKRFRQSKDGWQVMWNYDQCVGRKNIIITEGEIDALSYITAGYGRPDKEFGTLTLPNPLGDDGMNWGVTSVSQGAPNVNDTNVERKLECMTNSVEMFDKAERIYIAVDSDDNGKRLRDELLRRLDREKVHFVNFYDGYKDANELLRFEGVETLIKSIQKAVPYSPDGIYTAHSVKHEIQRIYKEGLPIGTSTHYKTIDQHWKWRLSEVNLWTGYANEGKTTFLNQLCLVKAHFDNWKYVIFSPENMPVAEYYEDLIHMYVGKTMERDNYDRMSQSQLDSAIDFVSDHFFIINPKEDSLIEHLFEQTEYLIRTQGVRGLILDPYNQIEHTMKSGESEHLYVSRFMSNLKRFAVENKISLNLVAHQNKPQTDSDGNYKRPDMYNIKGGGTFADKADNVLMVWRPYRKTNYKDPTVDFIAEKIKKKKLTGELGSTTLTYDYKANRFKEEYGGSLFHPMENEKIKETKPKQIDFFSTGDDADGEDLPF